MPRVAKSTLEQATETKATSTEKATVEVVKTVKEPIQEKKEEKTKIVEGKYIITCKDYANKKVFGTTGELITFDAQGKATVCLDEAKHFEKMACFTIQNL